MALASAPSTPERASAPFYRRSFTAPIKSTRFQPSGREADAQGAETLFGHPAGKIVAFSTSTNLSRRHSSVSDSKAELQDEPTGTLPWASITERTIAAGPLQIYRVLGSVAFLSSGKILHPVLAKSQCWCVDGVSKFVLRIRPNMYYRIELPHENRQDEEKVTELKKVLPNILQYEVTPCPFKRGFTVDLPEPPTTPVFKRPWKPKLPAEGLPQESKSVTRQLKPPIPTSEGFRQDDAKLSVTHEEAYIYSPIGLGLSDGASMDGPNIHDAHCAPNDTSYPDSIKESDVVIDEPPDYKTPTRPRPLRAGRMVTAPPQLSLKHPPSTVADQKIPSAASDSEQEPSSLSYQSSVDSFHSFHSPISPLGTSPLSSSPPPGSPFDKLSNPKSRRHERDQSDSTVTNGNTTLGNRLIGSKDNVERSHHLPPELPRTPTLHSSQDSDTWAEAAEEPTPPQIRLRKTRASRRPRSPLPSSSNLYAPYSPGAHISGHHLTTAILQRTCSLLLGPPVQLVALMLRIASKIAKGAFQGSAYGYGEKGQKIPCSWDFSDGSGDDDVAETIELDDYGVAIGKTTSGVDVLAKDVGGSWEID